MKNRLYLCALAAIAWGCGPSEPADGPDEDPIVIIGEENNGDTTPQPDSGPVTAPDLGGDADSGSEPDMGSMVDMATPDGGDPVDPDMGVPPDMNMGPDLPYAVPPERWQRQPSVTHDVDADLDAVLEYSRLQGACDDWNAGIRDDTTKLLCGKWMFFYETFDTAGVPLPILEFAQRWYTSYYGVGFDKFGFIPDPNSTEGMPIGLAPTTAMLGSVETRAFTCASCHFGQMQDGRYAVGYGNMNLDYGRFLAGLGAPLAMSLDENSASVHPDLRAELLPHVQAAKQNPLYQLSAGQTGLELLGSGAGPGSGPSIDDQEKFMASRRGTMDFLTEPIIDDGVWTISRILPLWNLPDDTLRAAAGMPHEMLSWTGGSMSLEKFLLGFARLGLAQQDIAEATERNKPLAAYIRSLQVPERLITIDQAAATRGAQAFVDEGCAACHSGPSGESSVAYSYTELGVDSAMDQIFNPDANDQLCCGFPNDDYEVTHGIKAPRIMGVENQTKWLHNGSVDSLEQLFCLQPRVVDNREAMGSEGHEYGCDLGEAKRRDLIEYLRTL